MRMKWDNVTDLKDRPITMPVNPKSSIRIGQHGTLKFTQFEVVEGKIYALSTEGKIYSKPVDDKNAEWEKI